MNEEPYPDVPSPTPQNEEIVDPTIPSGNSTNVIIHRHPFGLFALYIEVFLGLGIGIGLFTFLASTALSGETKTTALHWVELVSVIIIALAAIFLVIATSIYQRNYWLITDNSITQVLQKGLFFRQTSELSMANIEDVNAMQKGILASLFGFGTIRAETAGERSDFEFIYCPKPTTNAKIILDARERFINEDPAKAKRANELLDVPRT